VAGLMGVEAMGSSACNVSDLKQWDATLAMCLTQTHMQLAMLACSRASAACSRSLSLAVEGISLEEMYDRIDKHGAACMAMISNAASTVTNFMNNRDALG